MVDLLNELEQPIGKSVAGCPPARFPPYTVIEGDLCRIEPIDVERHSKDLFEAYAMDTDDRMWTYMSYGPFKSIDSVRQWLDLARKNTDPQFYVIVEKSSNRAIGLSSYMRIKPEHGVLEVGGISFSPHLQRTAAATEAMYLMMKRAFEDLGYRRYEWKCDALNYASCKAAERFGFSYEGTFRNHIVYHCRNRDTAWYSVIDDDWYQLKNAYQSWLAPENFDGVGQQLEKLADLIAQERY